MPENRERFLLALVHPSAENCRFVNDVLQRGKRRKDEFGRAPVEGAHGEIVVFSIPDSKLFLEVLEGKEFV